mgnify:FL=1
MDAFYASVEQRDQPHLKGKPVAVGGSGQRGVIAAASYEAREYGVRSAMSSRIAQQKCRHLVFVKPRFTVYKAVSNQIREIFYEYTDLVEPLSLDEAYLDVTENKKGIERATVIANEIRQKIYEQTQLTASAGISMNKFLAKTASDINKPNGYCLIHPTKAEEFVKELPIKKFFGIGKATARRMNNMGIHKGEDLLKYDLPQMIRLFGKSGNYYYKIIRAIDDREVKPNRKAKSVSVENTFSEDLTENEQVINQLKELSTTLKQRLRNRDLAFKTVVLKVRFNDFETLSRNKSWTAHTKNTELIQDMALDLWQAINFEKPVRLLGVGVGNILRPDEGEAVQLTLKF